MPSTHRKATFTLPAPLLDEFDIIHLKLQLQLGKANAPQKSQIVTAALTAYLQSLKAENLT